MLLNMFEVKGPIKTVLVCCKLFGTYYTKKSNIKDHICIMQTY